MCYAREWEGIRMNRIIKQIVARDCHVGESDTRVIRHVISRLKNKYSTYAAMPRSDRRLLMKDSIACHRENQELYAVVMGGR